MGAQLPTNRLLRGGERKQAKIFCLKRDGAGCCRCPKYKREEQALTILELDHRDNNDRNNPRNGSNWQLLCRAHNHLKNPRAKGRFHPEKALRIEDLQTTQPQSAEMEKNLHSEPEFIEWLRIELEDKGEMNIDEAINSGAYIADCSQKTIQRYINKHASRAGEFILDRETKMIRLKDYKSEPEDNVIITDEKV